MTSRNLILIVLRDILIRSVILVCVGEDWLVLGLLYFLSTITTIIKMKCFEFMRICDILIMGLFTWRWGNRDR